MGDDKVKCVRVLCILVIEASGGGGSEYIKVERVDEDRWHSKWLFCILCVQPLRKHDTRLFLESLLSISLCSHMLIGGILELFCICTFKLCSR